MGKMDLRFQKHLLWAGLWKILKPEMMKVKTNVIAGGIEEKF